MSAVWLTQPDPNSEDKKLSPRRSREGNLVGNVLDFRAQEYKLNPQDLCKKTRCGGACWGGGDRWDRGVS